MNPDMMNNQPMPPMTPMGGNPMQGQMQGAPQMSEEEARNMAALMLQRQMEAENLVKMPKQLRQYMEMPNIADDLTEKQLIDIAQLVVSSTDSDSNSRSEWEELTNKVVDLVNIEIEGKSWPWEKSANVKFPMVMGACIQFNARMMPEIIKNDKVVIVRNMSPDDDKHSKCYRADDLAAHMSYQLLGQSTHWVVDTDQMLMMLPLLGIVFRKSFYNSIIKQPDTQLVSPLDVIVNKNARSLETAQRITHRFSMSTNEIIEQMKAGLFCEYPIEELMKMGSADDQEASYTIDESQKNAFFDQNNEMLEQHRYLDLDGDGYQEPYIVTVRKESLKTMRIVARYDANSIDYDDKGELVKINPVQYWTDYRFIPDPAGGFYSFGFGQLLFSTNMMANSLLNQLIDAGTLSNLQGGYISRNLRLPKGNNEFKPGEWKQVNTMAGTSIADNIFPLPIKEPSATLFTLLQFVIDSSKAITAVSDVMQGDLPPSTTPAATTLALIEQGQKIYSAILYRIYNSLQKEFLKLYDINKKYLQQEEKFPLAIGSGMIKFDDYQLPNYGIFPVADPQLASGMQRLLQAQAVMQTIQMPQVDPYAVLHNYFEALKVTNINEVLPPPNPNAPPSADTLLKEAQLRNLNMNTACLLMEKELQAIRLQIDEMKQKSQTAYYGGQLATQKIDAITKLAKTESELGDQQVQQAAIEENNLTTNTQMKQEPTPDIMMRITALEGMLQEMMGGLQKNVSAEQGLNPQQQQPQQMQGGAAPQGLSPEQIAQLSGQVPQTQV